jgi:hypothetical protein
MNVCNKIDVVLLLGCSNLKPQCIYGAYSSLLALLSETSSVSTGCNLMNICNKIPT